jgi:thioredoxin reductase
MITTNYIIIGGGFSGLFLKKLLDENKIKNILLDGQNLGGQLNLYLNKYIYDIPGILKITAQDLLNILIKSIDKNTIIENIIVKKIIQQNDKKLIYGIKNNEEIIIECKSVIGATGKGIVEPMVLDYPGLDLLKAHNKLFFTLNNTSKKNVAVLGGGDGALDAVDHFLNEGCEVHIIHRRNLTAMAGKIQIIENNPHFHRHLFVNIENFQYDDDDKNVIIHLKNNTNATYTILVHEVYMFYGLTTNDNPLKELLPDKKISVDYATMKPINTLLDYMMGDGAVYPDKRYLIHNYIAEAHRILDDIKDNY